MSLILNIDASLNEASVSIGEDGKIVDSLRNEKQNEHASFLHVAIDSLIKKNKITLKDLDAVACTVGPGSYTGLRVGLAAAKGICYALDKKLITVLTTEALTVAAINFKKDNDILYCPMIDARRMEVFTALYSATLQPVKDEYALILNDDSFSEEMKEKQICFFGNGMDKWKRICKNSNAIFSEVNDIRSSFCEYAFEKFLQNNYADLILSSPVYVKQFYDTNM